MQIERLTEWVKKSFKFSMYFLTKLVWWKILKRFIFEFREQYIELTGSDGRLLQDKSRTVALGNAAWKTNTVSQHIKK